MKLLSTVVLLSVLAACGTPRNVQVSQETDTREERIMEDSSAVMTELDRIIHDMMSEDIERMMSQDIEIEKTIYSLPDSNGVQHVVERQTVKVNTQAKEKCVSDRERTSIEKERSDSVSVSSEEINSNEHEIVSTIMEDSLKWWQKMFIWVGVAAVAAIVIKIVVMIWK